MRRTIWPARPTKRCIGRQTENFSRSVCAAGCSAAGAAVSNSGAGGNRWLGFGWLVNGV
jgi:hypothetical protein